MEVKFKENNKCNIVAKLMTAIHWSNYDEVRNVLENCDNSELIVNCRSGPMMVLPLQLASYLRNQQDAVKIVKLLLNHGAKANCCDKIGRTPLHHAAILGSEDVVRLLLEAGASPNNRYVLMPWKNDGSYNLFRCSHGMDCAREVTAANNLPVPRSWGYTPLHEAVKSGHINCIKLLLEYRANINAVDENGVSPLLLLVNEMIMSNTSSTLTIERYEMIVDLLVSKGAFVNIACENTKCTPLHHSVKIGSVTATRILIDKDAKIESEEINGETPLHIAASVGNIDVLNILLMKCSKNLINYPDKAGCTPLHKAASSGHKDCLSALLKKGGDLAAETNTGVTVVDEIFTNLTRPVDFLLRILDSKITFTQHNSVLSSDHGCKILLDFDLLTPKNITKQKSILLLLVEERGNSIIQHPLIEALISLKWKKMKLIFLLLLIAHVCFVSTLSVYAFALVHSGDVSETSSFIWMFLEKNERNYLPYLLLLFSTLMLLQSAIELVLLGPLRWKVLEPWLKFICPLSSMVLVCIVLNKGETPLVIDSLCYVSSVVVLFGWAQVMFLLARFPQCGYYGLMFLAVLTNVTKVLMSFICLIIGFTFCFCIQFPDNDQFQDPFVSFIKTITMMAGEFKYKHLFKKKNGRKDFCTSRFIFLLFILLVTVVLMNLMVGLAVSDIQDLLIKGHIKCLKKQAEFVTYFEKFSSHTLLKKQKFIYDILKRYKLPTKLVIDANTAAANSKLRCGLSNVLMDEIISIALKNRKKEKIAKKPSTVSSYPINSYYEPPDRVRVSNILDVDGGSKSTPGQRELFTQMLDIKQMLQFVIEIQQNDSNLRSNSDDEEEDELNSKVYALLRRMSQTKKRCGGNVIG